MSVNTPLMVIAQTLTYISMKELFTQVLTEPKDEIKLDQMMQDLLSESWADHEREFLIQSYNICITELTVEKANIELIKLTLSPLKLFGCIDNHIQELYSIYSSITLPDILLTYTTEILINNF